MTGLFSSDVHFANPYATYNQLKQSGPFMWSDELGSWLVFEHDYVTELLRLNDLSSERDKFLRFTVAQRTELVTLRRFFGHWLMFNDSPDHTRYRNFASKLISSAANRVDPTAIAEMLREEMRLLIDSGQAFDLNMQIAKPVSVVVLANMFNFDIEALSVLLGSSERIVQLLGHPDFSFDEALEAQVTLARVLHAAESCLSPDDTMNYSDVTRQEQQDIVVNLILDGYKSLCAGICNSLFALKRYGGPLDHSDADETAETLLRLEPPFQYVSRIAKHELRVKDLHLKKGDRIMLFVAACNRDGSEACPVMGHVGTKKSLTFGHGRHYCVGASVARLTTSIVVNEFLKVIEFFQVEHFQFERSLGYRSLCGCKARFLPCL